jgi:HSP20 family protein
MSSMRFEPWSGHRELLNDLGRLYDQRPVNDGSSGATADWIPAVDVEEYGDKFVIYADVPGVDSKQIEITLEKGLLTLSGERRSGADQQGIERQRTERARGRFYRRFSLPDTADSEAVSARGNNGVLEIVIPKRPTAQPRRISVNP